MISVCMTTCNGEKYLRPQIDSILNQLSDTDELIISDDASSDNTLDIIRSYKDDRIKVFHHSPDNSFSNHQKATANFENALNYAKGDYIFLADQDDFWLPNKVNECVKALQKSDFVVHNMKKMDVNEQITVNNVLGDNVKIPKNWLSIIWKFKFWGCCMAFSKNVLNYILPIPAGVVGHDYWIMALAIKRFNCLYIPDVLINYREHIDSVSYKNKTSLFYKISYRLNLFVHILKRK